MVVTITAGLVDVNQVSLLAVADHHRDVLLQGQAEAALIPAPAEAAATRLVPGANIRDDQDLARPRVGATAAECYYQLPGYTNISVV